MQKEGDNLRNLTRLYYEMPSRGSLRDAGFDLEVKTFLAIVVEERI